MTRWSFCEDQSHLINKSNRNFARRIDGSIQEPINPSNEHEMVIAIITINAIEKDKNTWTPRLKLSFIHSQEDGAR